MAWLVVWTTGSSGEEVGSEPAPAAPGVEGNGWVRHDAKDGRSVGRWNRAGGLTPAAERETAEIRPRLTLPGEPGMHRVHSPGLWRPHSTRAGFARLLPQLRATLSDLARKGRSVFLVVDEAHLLPHPIFDQLRFLLNDEMDSASLLTLVLLGQPDLAHKLRFAPFEALSQRIAVRYHLNPFDLQETAAYVQHHLLVAGRQEPLFSDSFLALVHNHTKGVARKINNLCRTALLLGATEKKTILDETDLKRVIRDLEGQIG